MRSILRIVSMQTDTVISCAGSRGLGPLTSLTFVPCLLRALRKARGMRATGPGSTGGVPKCVKVRWHLQQQRKRLPLLRVSPTVP